VAVKSLSNKYNIIVEFLIILPILLVKDAEKDSVKCGEKKEA
jgi:hypothetical protein